MPHIHTQPGQHDITTSAFIIRMINDVPHMLLHLHKKHGKLLQPGGHVELHETPWQAIAHELEEETGYSLDELDILQPSGMITSLPGIVMHPVPSTLNTHRIDNQQEAHYHTDMAFTFVAAAPPTRKPQEGESQDLRWLTLGDIDSLDDSEIYPDTVELCRHAFVVTLQDWPQIPAKSFSV